MPSQTYYFVVGVGSTYMHFKYNDFNKKYDKSTFIRNRKEDIAAGRHRSELIV